MGKKDQTRADGASSLSNLRVTMRYLDPEYALEVHDLKRGDTGLLKVFSLTTKNPQKPSFRARVDDGNPGSRRSPELDIDIESPSEKIKKDFKARRNGFAGHHTDRSPNSQERIFEVEITVPSGKVFEGDVFFNVHFTMTLGAGIFTVQGLEANLLRSTSPKPNRSWLERIWAPVRASFGRIFTPPL